MNKPLSSNKDSLPNVKAATERALVIYHRSELGLHGLYYGSEELLKRTQLFM